MIKFRVTLPTIIGLLCLTNYAYSQPLLDKKISIEASNQRMADVLKQISNKGNFFFSYNSNIIKNDSLISFSATNKSLKQVLDQLCSNRFTWKQNNNYIILRKTIAPPPVASPTPSVEKLYTVSGFVLNSETGEKVSNVSIYEKERLVSTLSDDKGYFKIKLKSRYSTASLTISREMFEDTTVVIQPKYNQQVTIVMTPVAESEPVVTISPVENEQPDTIVVKPPIDTITTLTMTRQDVNQVEKTRWGKRLLSAKQTIQSINLKKFFANRPFQVSLTPGLSTQGKLSSQVVNNISVNVIGGYTAGVNGVELASVFNINKRDVKYVQAAGLLNITGGSVTGVQLSGVHNNVLKDVNGLQASGISNYVKGSVKGVQLGSIYNHVHGSVTGLQASNFSNFIRGKLVGVQLANFFNHVTDSVTGLQATNIINSAGKRVSGVQIATIGNVSRRELNGAQIGFIFNYAKKLRGVQIGLINISDTSEGYSIGLVNIVFKGYHKLMISKSEVLDVNAAFKTGNSKLYSILLTGYRKREYDSSGIISFGYGLGHEFAIGKRFSINPELTSQYLYMGGWDNNTMSKLHVQFTVKLNKYISLFAGPSFTAYFFEQTKNTPANNSFIPAKSYRTFDLWGNDVKGWIGWNAGINIF